MLLVVVVVLLVVVVEVVVPRGRLKEETLGIPSLPLFANNANPEAPNSNEAEICPAMNSLVSSELLELGATKVRFPSAIPVVLDQLLELVLQIAKLDATLLKGWFCEISGCVKFPTTVSWSLERLNPRAAPLTPPSIAFHWLFLTS